jgi:DNA-binding protein Fis
MEKEIGNLNDLFFSEHQGQVYRFLIESLEKPLFRKVLSLTNGNQMQASRVLGINRNTLRAKLKKLGIIT